jgi:hypothetical protein
MKKFLEIVTDLFGDSSALQRRFDCCGRHSTVTYDAEHTNPIGALIISLLDCVSWTDR